MFNVVGVGVPVCTFVVCVSSFGGRGVWAVEGVFD